MNKKYLRKNILNTCIYKKVIINLQNQSKTSALKRN